MTTKRFIKLQFIFLVLLVISLICNTLAWAIRPAVRGGNYMNASERTDFAAIELVTPDKGYFINGSGYTAKTYLGSKDETTGKITYSDTEITLPYKVENSDTGDVYYFKTIISPPENKTTTNVSLFINGHYDSQFGGRLMLGVSFPIVKSISMPSTTTSGTYNVFRFTPIVRSYEVKDTTSIEWFVNDTTEGSNIAAANYYEISEIILANN